MGSAGANTEFAQRGSCTPVPFGRANMARFGRDAFTSDKLFLPRVPEKGNAMTILAAIGNASAALHGNAAGGVRNGAPTHARHADTDNRSSSGSAAGKTSTVTNADGSTTTTVTSAAGSVVSISTSGGTGGGLPPSGSGAGLYTTGGGTPASSAEPAALLSLLV